MNMPAHLREYIWVINSKKMLACIFWTSPCCSYKHCNEKKKKNETEDEGRWNVEFSYFRFYMFTSKRDFMCFDGLNEFISIFVECAHILYKFDLITFRFYIFRNIHRKLDGKEQHEKS